MRSVALTMVAIATFSLAACGGARTTIPKVADAERTRAGLTGKDAQTLAPQAFAIADQELKLAREAESKGDAVGAELHAERAVAAYAGAVALARLARATEEEAAAKEALGHAADLATRYGAQRKAIDREAEDLEKQLRIARETQQPPASGAADPERERARLVATHALVTQARLLCSAARLVSASAPGLGEAETAVGGLEKQLESGRGAAPIDAAARARAACLASLTKARRASTTEADQTDALLTELSQAGASGSKLEIAPTRDERGVVVTLRGIWSGSSLTTDGAGALKDLGRVAAAHPTFGVQVVLHDATPPNATESATNKQRGESAMKALSEGGVTAAKVKIEQAGARAPVVDPQDTKRRERNARVEIVFVAPGT